MTLPTLDAVIDELASEKQLKVLTRRLRHGNFLKQFFSGANPAGIRNRINRLRNKHDRRGIHVDP